MILSELKQKLERYAVNIPGWRTLRKIIVIESDDWGSIRMPSKEVYKKCLKSGYPVDKIAYERYDSLASEEDIEMLFGLLTSFKDNKGNHPVMTANCVVANPDFRKIKTGDFKNYHYELITDTFKWYPKHSGNFSLWQQGMGAGIFHPQFHAREHVNVSLFMNALQRGDADAHFGFENRMPGSIPVGPGVQGNYYVEATKYYSLKDKEEKLSILLEGLDLFQKLFGYESESIIPPNYTWSPDFNSAVFKKGVKFFQGNRKIREPMPDGKFRFNTHFLGEKNKLGQIYLIRNVLFEPSLTRSKIRDPVDKCLFDIEIAFRMHKPAVIRSHRINYVGFLDENNRDQTLKFLTQVLKTALKRWPDIEFMTSDELGRVIASDIK